LIDPLTLEAEIALRRLGGVQGFFTTARRATPPRPGGRIRSNAVRGGTLRPVGSTGYSRTLQEVVLVRAVSIIEAYVFDLTQRELASRVARLTRDDAGQVLVAHLVEEKWRPIKNGGWAKLLDFCKDGLKLNPRQFEDWQELDLLRETRHAVTHRVGDVTQKYVAAASTVGRLKKLGVEPGKMHGLVPLDNAYVVEEIELCRRFVMWFDALVRADK
jgi:hypothetical protein